jgi:AhpC/TSA family
VPLAPGNAVPAVRLLDLEGRETSLARGRPAVLFFYKGECPASDVAARVLPRFAAVPGLAVVAVSQDEPESTRAFAAAHGWSGTAGLDVRRDPEPWPASDALEVRATPTWVLVDGAGRVAAVSEGWSRDDANRLAAQAARLAGAPPPVVAPDDGATPAFRPG